MSTIATGVTNPTCFDISEFIAIGDRPMVSTRTLVSGIRFRGSKWAERRLRAEINQQINLQEIEALTDESGARWLTEAQAKDVIVESDIPGAGPLWGQLNSAFFLYRKHAERQALVSTIDNIGMTMDSDGVARADSTQLARFLGYKKLQAFRRLIERNMDMMERYGTVATMATISENGSPVTNYRLNRRQVLDMITQSQTKVAKDIRFRLITVLDMVASGELTVPQAVADKLTKEFARDSERHYLSDDRETKDRIRNQIEADQQRRSNRRSRRKSRSKSHLTLVDPNSDS